MKEGEGANVSGAVAKGGRIVRVCAAIAVRCAAQGGGGMAGGIGQGRATVESTSVDAMEALPVLDAGKEIASGDAENGCC